MKKYPLGLSVYYLNFSYSHTLNLETRFFITIPFSGTNMENLDEISALELCFEMSSAFNKNKSEDNIDLGLFLRVANKTVSLSNYDNDIQKLFYLEFMEGANYYELKFLNSEKELYEEIFALVKNALTNSYGNNWDVFVKNNYEEFLKECNPVDENTKQEYLQEQREKINKFINEVINRLEMVTNATSINSYFMNKYSISINDNTMNVVNNSLITIPFEELVSVRELNNLIKTRQLLQLDDELPKIKENPSSKIKKL